MSQLYVGNLCHLVTEPILYELFSHAGRISRLRLPPSDDAFKYAFIDYEESSCARYALLLYSGNIALFGHSLRLRLAKQGGGQDAAVQIYLRPLPQSVDEADILQLGFLLGPLLGVTVPRATPSGLLLPSSSAASSSSPGSDSAHVSLGGRSDGSDSKATINSIPSACSPYTPATFADSSGSHYYHYDCGCSCPPGSWTCCRRHPSTSAASAAEDDRTDAGGHQPSTSATAAVEDEKTDAGGGAEERQKESVVGSSEKPDVTVAQLFSLPPPAPPPPPAKKRRTDDAGGEAALEGSYGNASLDPPGANDNAAAVEAAACQSGLENVRSGTKGGDAEGDKEEGEENEIELHMPSSSSSSTSSSSSSSASSASFTAAAVEMPTIQQRAPHRGYAFLTFDSLPAAQKAMRLLNGSGASFIAAQGANSSSSPSSQVSTTCLYATISTRSLQSPSSVASSESTLSSTAGGCTAAALNHYATSPSTATAEAADTEVIARLANHIPNTTANAKTDEPLSLPSSDLSELPVTNQMLFALQREAIVAFCTDLQKRQLG